MIKNFADEETRKIWNAERSHKLPGDIQQRAPNKLLLVDAAAELSFLRSPPGNRLESLRGNRSGQHSIRINDQRRICFKFENGNAHDVEICDYH